jgi:hypothetical protein
MKMKNQKLKKALNTLGLRECFRCNTIQDLSNFYPDKCQADGLHFYCSGCEREMRAARWHKKRREEPMWALKEDIRRFMLSRKQIDVGEFNNKQLFKELGLV